MDSYSITPSTRQTYAEYMKEQQQESVWVRLHRLIERFKLFRTRHGEIADQFEISNEPSWVREARIEEDENVSPSYPMDMYFQLGEKGFENPFLIAKELGWVPKTQIEEEVSPSDNLIEEGETSFAGWNGNDVRPQSWFSDDSDTQRGDSQYEDSPCHSPYRNPFLSSEEELNSLYSELLEPNIWIVEEDDEFLPESGTSIDGVNGDVFIVGDDEDEDYEPESRTSIAYYDKPSLRIENSEFVTESGTSIDGVDEDFIVGNNDDGNKEPDARTSVAALLRLKNLVADDSYSFDISELDNLVSDLQSWINDQICASAFLEMDVDALVCDFQNLDWQLTCNDELRGKCYLDLSPHPFSSRCGCYHCVRYQFGLDQDELHDLAFCPCVECFIVRQKGKKADRDRAQENAHKTWTTKLLKSLQPKTVSRKQEDEQADQDNTVGMFDLVKRGLRGLSE